MSYQSYLCNKWLYLTVYFGRTLRFHTILLHTNLFYRLKLIIIAISQVKTALKRGIRYGILRRYRGHYFLPTGDELDRANRIAMRFARLPTPGPLLAKSKTNCVCKIKNHKRSRGIDNTVRKSRKVEKSRISSVSASSSLTDKFVNDAVSMTEWNYLTESVQF